MNAFSQWKTIGYAIALFVTGGISGGALGIYETKSHLFVPPREQDLKVRMLAHLENKLELTPEQVSKVGPIIDRAVTQMRSIRLDTMQRVNKVFEDSYGEIAAVLTPEQKAKLDLMQKERLDMMQLHRQENRRHPGDGDHDGPGPGGGTSPQ